MKKLFAVILIIVILPVIALANPDVSSMTDQELRDMIAACSAELRARATSEPDGILIFEWEGVKVYQIGDPYISFSFLYVPVAVYNDTDSEMVISPENVLCNGWSIYGGSCRAPGKAKKKDTISFNVEDANVSELNTIDSLSFHFEVYDYTNRKTVYEGETSEYRFW